MQNGLCSSRLCQRALGEMLEDDVVSRLYSAQHQKETRD